jgi:hypothetical protein
MPIIIDEHADISVSQSDYELRMDVYVETTDKNGRKTGQTRIERMGGSYHSNFASALNRWVELQIFAKAADPLPTSLPELLKEIRVLKAHVSGLYSEHVIKLEEQRKSKPEDDN